MLPEVFWLWNRTETKPLRTKCRNHAEHLCTECRASIRASVSEMGLKTGNLSFNMVMNRSTQELVWLTIQTKKISLLLSFLSEFFISLFIGTLKRSGYLILQLHLWSRNLNKETLYGTRGTHRLRLCVSVFCLRGFKWRIIGKRTGDKRPRKMRDFQRREDGDDEIEQKSDREMMEGLRQREMEGEGI